MESLSFEEGEDDDDDQVIESIESWKERIKSEEEEVEGER